jgi:hypothetical protein
VSSSSGAHQPVLVGSTWLLKFQFSEKWVLAISTPNFVW